MPINTNKQKRAKEMRIASWPPAHDNLYQKLGATHEELANLQMAFQGTIVLPTDPEYDQDRQGNTLYPEYPKILAYCQSPSDVSIALGWAHDKPDWVVTCRSGGHSTAGFSVNNGMVLDVSNINHVIIDKIGKKARVGAGANWGQVIAELDANEVHTVTGGCPDVGVAGYLQGGGYGFTSREFGMGSDNVVQMRVVLADGTTVVATKTNEYADLFWAMRGGTGNNFGVLIEVILHLYDVNNFWGFGIRWPLENASAALALMQAQYMKSGAPRRLGYQTVLATMKDGNRALAMLGMFDGPPASGMTILQPLLATQGADLFYQPGVQSYSWLNEHLLDDNLFPPVDGLIELKQAGYIAKPMFEGDWVQVVNYFQSSPNKYDIVVIEPYGGTINVVPVKDSAFIHRDVYMDFFVDSFFFESGQPTSRGQAQQWLQGYMNLMQGNFNGRMYQNYPIRNFPGFPTAYWDQSTFNQLRTVKTKYDRDNFFRFEQSIPPYTDAVNIKRANASSFLRKFQKKAKPSGLAKTTKGKKVSKSQTRKTARTVSKPVRSTNKRSSSKKKK
jgi:FAD binding domain/Berberine and berberine like